MIPYGRQEIDESDIEAVVNVLKSDWLTTGPAVEDFEKQVATYVGAKHAVAFANGTAALHGITHALGITEGDEVITTPITFVASANCVIYQGGTPVFADVCSDTLLIDPKKVEEKITPRTKAVIAVDYAGQACDYDALRAICDKHNLQLIADGCHAIGGKYHDSMVGSVADMTAFSFHPVKHITTGEGGMVTTDDDAYAASLRSFRGHGITTDFRQREKLGGWFYEMEELGYNYRITDIQCALGISQLKRLDLWIAKRNELAAKYDSEFAEISGITPLAQNDDTLNAYHLYVIKIDAAVAGVSREEMFKNLREAGVGVNVHYMPVYLHPYYQKTFNYGVGLCPQAEAAYEQIISLPIYPGLSIKDQDFVITKIKEFCHA